jgi:hypothetical protein
VVGAEQLKEKARSIARNSFLKEESMHLVGCVVAIPRGWKFSLPEVFFELFAKEGIAALRNVFPVKL